MWRIWTKGWGVRAWWRWFTTQGFPVWLAWRLPRWLAYWAYIRVYAAGNDGASEEYARTAKAWEAGAGR